MHTASDTLYSLFVLQYSQVYMRPAGVHTHMIQNNLHPSWWALPMHTVDGKVGLQCKRPITLFLRFACVINLNV